MGVWIVISAFNEANVLPRVINDLKEHGYNDLIVVDDGSVDGTKKVAEINGAIALRHIINRGRGATLKTGIDYALLNDANIIITFDGDGQHQAKDISKLIKPILDKKADIVLGSRFLTKKPTVPFGRKILLKGSIMVERTLYGLKLTDAHNGLRALSKNAAEKIEITMNDRAYCTELIGEIKKHKLRYKEVPVDVKYNKRTLKSGLGIEAVYVLVKMLIKRLI